MRAGLKNDTLGTLLFPRDPVGNAPALIHALAAAFPAKQGSYLLGLLARIGWFTPTLVLFDLALILEFGARTRLLVLGRISALLPSPDNDLMRLILDSMGVIDFDAGHGGDRRRARRFAAGAQVRDDRCDGAARALELGPGSGFILAVGGFNPHFAPAGRPAGAAARGHRAELRATTRGCICDAYFADHLEHRAVRRPRAALRRGLRLQRRRRHRLRRAGASIAPLQFVADFHAKVQLKHGSTTCSWSASKASSKGQAAARQRQGDLLDLLVRLHRALRQDPGRRRSAAAAAGHRRARATPAGAGQPAELDRAARARPHPGRGASGRAAGQQPLVLDPLGRLLVKQQVVPLNTGRDIETFGGAPVSGRAALPARGHVEWSEPAHRHRAGPVRTGPVLRAERRREAGGAVVRDDGRGADLRRQRPSASTPASSSLRRCSTSRS